MGKRATNGDCWCCRCQSQEWDCRKPWPAIGGNPPTSTPTLPMKLGNDNSTVDTKCTTFFGAIWETFLQTFFLILLFGALGFMIFVYICEFDWICIPAQCFAEPSVKFLPDIDWCHFHWYSTKKKQKEKKRPPDLKKNSQAPGLPERFHLPPSSWAPLPSRLCNLPTGFDKFQPFQPFPLLMI